MTAVTDECLLNELNTFMCSIPELWTWDQLAAFGEVAHVERRGSDANYLNFELGLLEQSARTGRPFLHVYALVYDFREGSGLGSAYQPLSNSFLWFQDGELDLQVKYRFVPNPE